MSFAPLFASGPIVTFHAFAALFALVLGSLQLILAKKGGMRHRIVGYVWVALMAGIALSSFGIHALRIVGPFSPIHLLSIFSLCTIVFSIWSVRRGNINAHRKAMLWLFFAALIGAGLFTLLPGRDMHQVLFG